MSIRPTSGEPLLSSEERALLDQIREAAPQISTMAQKIDREVDLSRRRKAVGPLNAMMFELGLHSVELSAARGGLALSRRAKSIVLEELARADAGFAMAAKATAACASHLEQLGLPAVAERFLTPFLEDESGRWLLSGATTEPNVGSDAINFSHNASLATRAVKVAGGYELSGEKWMMTNCGVAAAYIIVAQRPELAGFSGRVVAVAASDTPGLTALPVSKRGLRTAFHGTLTLDHVCLPDDQVLVPPPVPFADLAQASQASLASVAIDMAALCVGVAQAALDVAAEHVSERVQGGRPLIEHQAVALRYGELYGAVAASRALTRESAALADRGALTLAHAAAARGCALDAARKTCAGALDLVGSPGLLEEHHLSKLSRDADALAIPFGSRDLLVLLSGH